MLREIQKLLNGGNDISIAIMVSQNLQTLGVPDLPTLDSKLTGLSNEEYLKIQKELLEPVNTPERRKDLSNFLDTRRGTLLIQEKSSKT